MQQPSGREMAGGSQADDFFDQMLSTLPAAWADLQGVGGKSPWEQLSAGAVAAEDHHSAQGPFGDDQSALQLASSRLRQHHQIGGDKSSSSTPAVMLQLSDLHRNGQLLAGGGGGEESGFSPLPLFTDGSPPAREQGGFMSPNATGGGDHAVVFNGFGTHGAAAAVQQQFGHQGGSLSPQKSLGGPAAASSGGAPGGATSSAGGGGVAAPPPRKQRVRARRGQATDPHSIAERLRRERIAERMKSLQELVPNGNKTDKASMLDEIIDYLKFLQLQVKVLSMSRLGGAVRMTPLGATMSSEGNSNGSSSGGVGSGSANKAGSAAAATTGGEAEAARVTSSEQHQVAKMMEEDMGTAMQYLQGKGLCLMPISLASAISSVTASSASLLSRPPVVVGRHAAASVQLLPDGGNDGAAAATSSPDSANVAAAGGDDGPST